MPLILAAIRSGTDPLAPLPPAAFHHTLEEPIYCPKCEATYSVIVDYDRWNNRFFAEEARRHLSLLRKAVFLDHAAEHRTTHFETNGVIVTRHAAPRPATPLARLKPATPHIN